MEINGLSEIFKKVKKYRILLLLLYNSYYIPNYKLKCNIILYIFELFICQQKKGFGTFVQLFSKWASGNLQHFSRNQI